MPVENHAFGGPWTEEKLNILSQYLQSYVTALKKQAFTLYYIDAFAGTGYIDNNNLTVYEETLLPEMGEPESKKFLEGSARVALQVEPPFDCYIFIEEKPSRCEELERLKLEVPNISNRISIENGEANNYIRNLCNNKNWISDKSRGVLFLDPYAMQVEWSTLEAVASTKAIDLWYLFPVMAVNRLLKKDGKITDANKKRLNQIFGTAEWEEVFYSESPQMNMFEEEDLVKNVNIKLITDFILGRLHSVFPGVASNPKVLYNTKNSPLFIFFFTASTNSASGIRLAKGIAQHILGQ